MRRMIQPIRLHLTIKMLDIEEDIDNIIDIVEANENLIDEAYNGLSDQILIDKQLIKKFFLYFQNKYNKKDETFLKEITIKVLTEAFELHTKDIILFKDGYIFIKFITQLEQNMIEGRSSSEEVRYNGFEEVELQSFLEESFSDKKLKILLENTAKIFVNTYIVEKKLSNEDYEKKVFGLIKQIIYKSLSNIYNNDDEFMLGLAGYIFRINFEPLFLYMADFLFNNLAKNEPNTKAFLDYYSNDVIIINNIKYKVPSIQTDNHKWKIVSILSIIRVYIKNKENKIEIEKKIKQFEIDAKACYMIEGISPLQQQKRTKEKLLKLNNKLNEQLKSINSYYSKLQTQNLTPDEKSDIHAKLKIEQANADKLKLEKEQILKHAIEDKIVQKYQKIQREVDALKRELSTKNKIIEQNKPTYQKLKKALVKALIQKKKVLASS